MSRKPSSGLVAIVLVVTTGAFLALTAIYSIGGQPQLEGILLGIGLGGLGVAAILWARDFLPVGGEVEERESLIPSAEEREETEETLEEGLEELGRRSFLVKLAAAALGSLGLAALFPIRSLGSKPGEDLIQTAWTDGVRIIDAEGNLIRADQVETGQVLTVFPDGHLDAVDAVTLLIGVSPGQLHPLPGREGWAQDGLVAYSKLCTHAGCPVGLYEPTSRRLFCPYHQS
ncbi:MAG TPA: Rieske (2Fe-2S) protein, partial [Longimicrobiales bacterium]|nr:Rieske (2Fe-2S) protein [Longimicrobiales bacterium]